jgi:hypothetical protein
MTTELQELLARPEICADHWLYKIQLLHDLPPEIKPLCEEMRPLVAHFVSIGVPMPTKIPQPDLYGRREKSISVALGRIKHGPSVGWQKGELFPADKEKCKRLHFLANKVRDILCAPREEEAA